MNPRSLRVHRVIARLNIGGPAQHVVHLARDLDRTGRYATTLLAGHVTADEGDMSSYAARHGVTPRPLDTMERRPRPTDDLRTLARLTRIFRRERPDIVHTHTAKAGALGRLAARWAGVPIVVHTYHGHVLGGGYFGAAVTRVYREVERQLARLTDCLIALTDTQADELARGIDIAPRERFEVIPLGLELAPFRDVDRATARAEVRAAFGTPRERLVVGIVGRLVPVKDHDLFLHAIAHLRATHPEIEAWVIGSGEREAELREVARGLGLDEGVRWLGWRHDLPRLLPALDVVALTSRDEGTPVAL
ncbi:MAG: glycosyltransferase, partial [Longimicrobiales bacterium]|nr:glycosyltransferase [Longimicrobiales bacterium]